MVLFEFLRESRCFVVDLTCFDALIAAGKKDGELSFEDFLHDYIIPRENKIYAPKGKQEKIKKRNRDARGID